jgi:membrane protein required for colicin V production
MPALNWLDLCLVGIIGISGLIGLMRGLVRELFSLAAWGVAVWVGLRYGRDLAAYLEKTISLPSARVAVAFGILFVGTLILAGLLAFFVGRLIDSTGLSGTDRLLGLVFGIARGVLGVCVLVLLAGATPLPDDPWWKESKLIPPFQELSLWLRHKVPSEYASRIKAPLAPHK